MQSQHQSYIGLQNFVLPFKLVAHLRDRLQAAAAVACHKINSPWNSPQFSNINGTLRQTSTQNRDYARIMANILHWDHATVR